MKTKFKRSIKALLVCIVCIPLVFFCLPTTYYGKATQSGNLQADSSVDLMLQINNKAYAEDLTSATLNYNQAKAAMDEVSAEYNQVMQKAESIGNQINDITNRAFEAQTEMAKHQQSLRDIATYEYKNSTVFSLAMQILQSENFDELVKNIDYANSVMEYQSQLSIEQAQRKAVFEERLEELNAAYADYQSTVNEATEKHNKALAVVNAASANLNAAQLAELSQQAEDIGGGSGGGTGGGGGGGDTPTPTPTPTPEPEPGSTWSGGIASAYGGSSDPSTPNPGRTATGEICDDWSTGVAVPMSWPNYRSYFGHTVQIRYNGQTVLARINDCGYMGGGSRSLDLQPGVFKAFGFNTCQAWGIRYVEYIIM